MKITYLAPILLAGCAVSSTPPMVSHQDYGEVNAEHPAFKTDAMACASDARGEVKDPVDFGPYDVLLEPETKGAITTLQMAREINKFFSRSNSCLSQKGWAIVE